MTTRKAPLSNFSKMMVRIWQRRKNKQYDLLKYRKIPNVSPGLIEVFKHFLGGLYSGGLHSGGLIFGGHFVLVSEYQDLKNHCFI